MCEDAFQIVKYDERSEQHVCVCRVETVKDRCEVREQELEVVKADLDSFLTVAEDIQEWITDLVDSLESREFASMDTVAFTKKISEMIEAKDHKSEEFMDAVQKGLFFLFFLHFFAISFLAVWVAVSKITTT